MDNLNLLTSKIYEKIIVFTPNFISAILLLFVGIYAIKFTIKMVRKIMLERALEPTLSNFLANILFWTLRILLFITVITQLGIGTSSFVAILGAAGLAVGLSLQGSLSNFSGGILIILFKPFKDGDVIEAQGVTGTVSEIQIFVTKIISGNNQTIFIPNGALSNGVITNYSMQGYRKADLNLSISYHTNIKDVKEMIMNVMLSNPKILKNPPPTVNVRLLTDSAIQLSVKPSANNADFADVCSDTLEQCKIAFDKAGIDVQPFVKENSI
jgi:small conductance mechanosensitive channel